MAAPLTKSPSRLIMKISFRAKDMLFKWNNRLYSQIKKYKYKSTIKQKTPNAKQDKVKKINISLPQHQVTKITESVLTKDFYSVNLHDAFSDVEKSYSKINYTAFAGCFIGSYFFFPKIG
jgi:hypothetical protein